MKTLTYLAAAASLFMLGCAASPAADKVVQENPPAQTAAAPAQPAAPVVSAQRAEPAPAASAPVAPAAAPSAPATPAARPVVTAALANAGKTVLNSSCAACHSPDIVTEQRHTQADWDEIIDTMVSRGAALTDDEHKTLLAYLSAAYGP